MKLNKTFPVTAALFCSLFAAATCTNSQQPSVPAERPPIVITSGRDHGHYRLAVEPNPHGEKDSLHLLSMFCEENGHDYPVLSLVDDNARISDMYNPVGLASKAQCDNVRTFALHRDT